MPPFRATAAMATLALLAMVVACGRSALDDDLGIVTQGDDAAGDAAETVDDAASPPTTDGSTPPTEDVTVFPPEDVSLIPPTADVTTFPPPPPPILPPPLLDSTPPPGDEVTVPPGGCSYATCSGCCDGQGGCHSGHDSSGCGGQGEMCKTCSGICVDGICLNLSTNCGPSNCTGCCLGTDVCADGLHAGACGSGGMQCESCNPTTGGGNCIARASGTGGACVTPPNASCGATSCSTGCCVGNLCVVGTQDIACGSGGIGCQDCTQNGRTCIGRTCSF